MSRVIGTATVDGVVIELLRQEPGYGDGFGYSVSHGSFMRQRVGFDTVGDALDSALVYLIADGVVSL